MRNDNRSPERPRTLDTSKLVKLVRDSDVFFSPYGCLSDYIQLFPRLSEECRFWFEEFEGSGRIYNGRADIFLEALTPMGKFAVKPNYWMVTSGERRLGLGAKLQQFRETEKALGYEGTTLVHSSDGAKIASSFSHSNLRYWHPTCGFLVQFQISARRFETLSEACNNILNEVEAHWKRVNEQVVPFFGIISAAEDSGRRN